MLPPVTGGTAGLLGGFSYGGGMDELKRKQLEGKLRVMLQRLKKAKKPDQLEKSIPDSSDGSGIIRRRHGKPDKRITNGQDKLGEEATAVK